MMLDPDLVPYFARAGWHDAWKSPEPLSVPKDHPAFCILQRFGEIHVHPTTESGHECGVGDVHFQQIGHRWGIVDEWEAWLNTRFVGIALASESWEQLWIVDDGRIFSTNDVTDNLGFVGDGFNDAIPCLVS